MITLRFPLCTYLTQFNSVTCFCTRVKVSDIIGGLLCEYSVFMYLSQDDEWYVILHEPPYIHLLTSVQCDLLIFTHPGKISNHLQFNKVSER